MSALVNDGYPDPVQTRAWDDHDDRSLVAAVVRREAGALEALIQRLQPALLRIVRTLVDEHRAEDVLQETWIHILRGLPAFRWNADLKTWAIRITLNQAYSTLRRERRHPLPDRDPGDAFDARGHWRQPVEPWHQDTPEALLGAAQLSDVLRHGLASLPEAQRLAVMLRDIEGMEMDSVCNILAVSPSNARVLLHRARARLREVIDAFQSGR